LLGGVIVNDLSWRWIFHRRHPALFFPARRGYLAVVVGCVECVEYRCQQGVFEGGGWCRGVRAAELARLEQRQYVPGERDWFGVVADRPVCLSSGQQPGDGFG
jgi:hypothetical protein